MSWGTMVDEDLGRQAALHPIFITECDVIYLLGWYRDRFSSYLARAMQHKITDDKDNFAYTNICTLLKIAGI